MRHETASLADTRQETFYQGEPAQQNVTDQQGTSYDMLNMHAFSETWLNNNLFLSLGYNFANLDNTFSGSRVYGDDFDVAYTPNPLNGLGYTSLNGGSHEQEHVVNVNLMATPAKSLTIVPSLRVHQDTWNADSSGIGHWGTTRGPSPAPVTGRCLKYRNALICVIRHNQLGILRGQRID